MASKHLENIEKLGPNRVKQNEPLAKQTTFGIGGPADLFYEAKKTIEWIKENEAGRPNFKKMREDEAAHKIEKVGKELRGMMPWMK